MMVRVSDPTTITEVPPTGTIIAPWYRMEVLVLYKDLSQWKALMHTDLRSCTLTLTGLRVLVASITSRWQLLGRPRAMSWYLNSISSTLSSSILTFKWTCSCLHQMNTSNSLDRLNPPKMLRLSPKLTKTRISKMRTQTLMPRTKLLLIWKVKTFQFRIRLPPKMHSIKSKLAWAAVKRTPAVWRKDFTRNF